MRTGWTEVSFDEACSDVSSLAGRLAKSEWNDRGQIPIIDQGASSIAGYTDDSKLQFRGDVPVIVFGDHTRRFKFVDHRFAVGADGVKLLKPSPQFDGRFLFWYLASRELPTAGYSRHFKFLKDVRVPLPPLDEQRRIAKVLEAAGALLRQRDDSAQLVASLTTAQFIRAFGTDVGRGARWPVRSLGDLTTVHTGGTPSRGVSGYFGGTVPWVKTMDIAEGVITSTSESLTESGLEALRGKLFVPGSIVVAMYGQGRTRGRTALLGIAAAANQACAVLQPSAAYEPRFMVEQLRLAYDRLRADSRGGNQPNLNLTRVADFPVLVPPTREQRAFAKLAGQADGLSANARSHRENLDALFASLQHRAFAGEL